jgi:hypothetical protein
MPYGTLQFAASPLNNPWQIDTRTAVHLVEDVYKTVGMIDTWESDMAALLSLRQVANRQVSSLEGYYGVDIQ